MKPEWKSCLRVSLCVFILFLLIYYWGSAAQIFGVLMRAAMPILAGLAMAYLLNILMSSYERHFFPKAKKSWIIRSRRITCMLAAFLTLIAMLALIFWLVIPELSSAVQFLAAEIPPAMEKFLSSEEIIRLIPPEKRAELAAVDWPTLIGKASKVLLSGMGNAMSTVAAVLSSAFSSVIMIFTGIIFSVYLLMGKDRLRAQCLRLMRACLPEKWQIKIMEVLRIFNASFHGYIVGQCTEAMILGALCALGMLIFGFPYAGMIGALVGFTALIPIAGAYIGAGVGAIMMLTVSPLKAILFLVFIVVLQQLEGNLIFPRVVGKSLGLPALWVMAAVTLGGGLMGIPGMMLGVPLVSALYQLVRINLARREERLAGKDPAALSLPDGSSAPPADASASDAPEKPAPQQPNSKKPGSPKRPGLSNLISRSRNKSC